MATAPRPITPRGPVIIDRDGLKTSRKFQDFLGLRDWPPSKPSNADMTLIGVCGNSLVPSTPKEPNQVVERGWVADLLDDQSIRSLSVDRCCQPLNFRVVDGLGWRSRCVTRLEQVFDIPDYHLEHAQLHSLGLYYAIRNAVCSTRFQMFNISTSTGSAGRRRPPWAVEASSARLGERRVE
jgi:hypothetical protein